MLVAMMAACQWPTMHTSRTFACGIALMHLKKHCAIAADWFYTCSCRLICTAS